MLLNPNAGARRGHRVWQRVAPLFKAAGIRLTVRETKRPSHAHVMTAGLTVEQLRTIDGAWAEPAWLVDKQLGANMLRDRRRASMFGWHNQAHRSSQSRGPCCSCTLPVCQPNFAIRLPG